MLLALAIGCINPYYTDSSCQYDVGDWYGDIGRYVWWGEELEKKVDFDAQLDEEYINKASGSYDKVDGTFSWSRKYAPDYWLQEVATADDFESFGTVFRNGNLDIIEKLVYTDILGDSWAVLHREERHKCEGTWHQRWSDGNGDIEEVPTVYGTYTIAGQKKVEYTEYDYRSGIEVIEEGTMKADFSSEGIRSASSDDFSLEESFTRTVQGGEESTFSQESVQNDGTVLGYDGTTTQAPSGLSIANYDYSEDGDKVAEVHTEIGYDGGGSGTWTFTDGTTCDLTYRADGTCSYECSNGSKGNDC